MKRVISVFLICSMLLASLPAMPSASAISQNDIVSTAKSLVDKYPYVSGGESPSEGGFDCTGLVYYVYHTCLGYNMTIGQARSKSALLSLGTKIVGKANFIPGDIVQFNYPHVAIYIGNNKIIEAAKPGTRVRERSIAYDNNIEYAIRLNNIDGSSSVPQNDYMTISGNNTPGTLKKGEGFNGSGVVNSNVGISWIWAGILDSSGNRYGEATAHPGANSYDISGLVSQLDFSKLQPGTYHYAVEATGSNGQYYCLIEDGFTVAENTYYLDLNGFLDGTSTSDLGSYGTADIYINGSLVADDCADYYTAWPSGTTYQIKDIKPSDNASYGGVHEGALSGTIGNGTVNVALKFSKTDDEKKPGVPALKNSKKNYAAEDGAVFYWNDVKNATQYGLIFDKFNESRNEWEWYDTYWNSKSGDKFKLPAGEYKVALQAVNDSDGKWLWTQGDTHYFNVLESQADESTVDEAEKVSFERQTVYFQDQFTDVPENQWFTASVAKAFEFGLMKGNSENTFNPYGDVTIAETITMAARIHSIYTTGTESFGKSSSKWYQTYLDYAYENGIIRLSYYNCDVTNKATRAQFAEILSNALPAEGLRAINNVPDNAIPDVKATDNCAAGIYRLYRAGILAGGDANGTFSPKTYITRAECAAIVSRIADSDERIMFSLK